MGADRLDKDRQELAMSQDAPVVIRQLGSGDVEVVRRLLDTFGEVFEDMDTYTRAQPREGYLEGLPCSDHFIALAAYRGGNRPGMGLPARNQRNIWIEHLGGLNKAISKN